VHRDDVVVGAQLAAIAGLTWPGRPRWSLPRPVAAGAAALIGTGVAVAAAGAKRQGLQLTPWVEPRANAELITDGVYAWTRNPMYAGILLAGAGLALLRRRPEPLVSYAALSAVLHVKTGMEERRLHARFGEAYSRYAERTPRLLGLRPTGPQPDEAEPT
jgi:protein-S-isoprenylcysteine O-methyltransferase Ste14